MKGIFKLYIFKLIILSLTMIFISFGVIAEYNKKFSKTECELIFNTVKLWIKEKEGFADCRIIEDSICSKNFRLVVSEININRNLYETFCKD